MKFLIALLLLAGVMQARAAALFRVTRAPFSFAHIGDMHAGTAGLDAAVYSNSFQVMIDRRVEWNLKMIVTPGDCFEETGDHALTGYWRTNMVQLLDTARLAGISVLPTPGNHESDTVGPIWWTNVFPEAWFEADPAFHATKEPEDTRDVVMLQTNSGMKFAFIGERWLGGAGSIVFPNEADVYTEYAEYNQWVTNVANQFSNHYVVHATHYMIDTNGQFSTASDLSSYVNLGPSTSVWTNHLQHAPNMLLGISGHTRLAMTTKLSVRASDGHLVTFVMLNTQTPGRCGGHPNGSAFKLYTFYPDDMRVHVQTYHSVLGRFMTNNEFGYVHDFTFPIHELP